MKDTFQTKCPWCLQEVQVSIKSLNDFKILPHKYQNKLCPWVGQYCMGSWKKK